MIDKSEVLKAIEKSLINYYNLLNLSQYAKKTDLTNYALKEDIPTVTNDLTNELKANYDAAYTHSQSTHAPTNAQANADITKAEIEAKLTGDITTHTHSRYAPINNPSFTGDVSIENSLTVGTRTGNIGQYSVAEGSGTTASGYASHAEGNGTYATERVAHAEGDGTTASGEASHAEGRYCNATSLTSHAEGDYSEASGYASHAEGNNTHATGNHSHTEGCGTTASGETSHAEGAFTTASGDTSHAEGSNTKASGNTSHAEGSNTTSLGTNSHIEGSSSNSASDEIIDLSSSTSTSSIMTKWKTSKFSLAKGEGSHVEGMDNLALGASSHAEGKYTTASGSNSHAEGNNTTASNNCSHAEGDNTTASGSNSHAEGSKTTASGSNSHAEGEGSKSLANGSHAEGYNTTAINNCSHAEGYKVTALGFSSHAEGESSNLATSIIQNLSSSTTNDSIMTNWNESKFSLAKGEGSHIEGKDCLALGDYSHAEGEDNTASGNNSHAEGWNTTASGDNSHAEGSYTTASGIFSHAEGEWTIASSEKQHVQGKYNIEDTTNTYAHIVGNGTSNGARSNAHTLDWNGNGWYAGNVSISGIPTNDNELTTKKYVDDSISNINDLPLLSSICMKNEDGTLVKSGVYYLLDFSKIPVDDTKFYLNDVTSTGKVFNSAYLGFEKDGVVDNNLKFRLSSSFPIISLGYRTSNPSIYISNTYNTISYRIDNNERIVSESYSLSEKVNKSQVITITNTNVYTPTNDYNPATKKYVDDSIKDAEVIQKIIGTDTVPIKLWELENGYYEVTGKYYDTLSSSTNITSEGLPELFVVDKYDNTSIVYSISGGYTITYTLNNGVLESDDNAVWTYNVSNNMVLELDNTEPYEPTGDYNPATKKYVDGKVENMPYTIEKNIVLQIPQSSITSTSYRAEFPIFEYDSNKRYIINYNNEEHELYQYPANLSSPNGSTIKGPTLLCELNSGKEIKIRLGSTSSGADDTKLYIEVGEIATTDLVLTEYSVKTLDNKYIPKHFESLLSISLGRKKGTAIGLYSSVLGYDSEATNYHAHAEGLSTSASGQASHAEGTHTISSGENSHAEGSNAKAIGDMSHAEGFYTEASGSCSHAEGSNTKAIGMYSHVEGSETKTKGRNSHAEGYSTIASGEYQHVEGKNNIEDTTNTYVHIVGNGTSDTARSNAHTLDWDGNAWYKGKLSQDGTPTEDKDLATKKYVDDAVANVSGGSADSIEWANVTGKPTFTTVATSGNYNDLTNKPTIPTKTSDLTNDSGFLTEHQDISGKANVSGQVFTGTVEAPVVKATSYFFTPALVNEGDLTSYYHRLNLGYANHDYWEFHEYGGDYRFYKNTAGTDASKTLVANITSTGSNFVGQLKEGGVRVYSPNNKPTASDLGLATVSTSGSYNDLSNKPTIPTVTNDLTDNLKSNYDTAYIHSQSAHAPTNAQANADITKAEIEAKLTGDITTHTHSQYLTDHQDLSSYAPINNPSFTGDVTVAGKVTVGTAPTEDMDVTTKKYVDENNQLCWLEDYEATGSKLQYADVNVSSLTSRFFYAFNFKKHPGVTTVRLLKSYDDGTIKSIINLGSTLEYMYLMNISSSSMKFYLKYSTGIVSQCVCTFGNTSDECTFERTPMVLYAKNTYEYTPTTDYNPATKKYVDDKFIALDSMETVGTIPQSELQKCNNGTSRYVSSIDFDTLFSEPNNYMYYATYKDDTLIPIEYQSNYNRMVTKELDSVDGLSVIIGFDYGTHIMYPFNGGNDSIKAYTFTNDLIIKRCPILIPSEVLTKNNNQEYTPTGDYNPATKKYVDEKVAGIVNSAPETLDTLNELATALGNDANFATTVTTQIGNKVDKVDGKGLSTNDLTNELKTNYDTAYTHSQSAHAPSNAQKNSDITKSEIEAKLTGNITTHTHSQYLTEHQDLSGYAPINNPSFTGDVTVTGKVTVGTAPTENMDVATKKYVDDNKFSGNYEDLNNEPFTFIPIKIIETNESNGTTTAYCDVFDLEQGHRYVADFTKYNYACLYTFNSDNTKNTLVTTISYLGTGHNGMITVMSSSTTTRTILWMSAYGSEQIKITKNSDETFTIKNSVMVPRVTNVKEFTPTSDYHLVHKKYVDDAVAANAGSGTGSTADYGPYSIQYNSSNNRLEFIYTPTN